MVHVTTLTGANFMTLKSSLKTAALAVAAAGALATSASAAIYVFSYSGAGISASGTITTSGGALGNPYPCATCATAPGYLVTAITGTRNGNPITGLLGLGALYGNDNHIYPGGPYLDWGDLGFSSAGVNYNIFQGNFDGHPGYFEANSHESCCYTHPIQFTLSAAGVPEPATWALMLGGVFGLGGLARRARATAVATA